MNSLIHGFEGRDNGVMDIKITSDETNLIIDYKDNGNGVTSEQLTKLFDPFFTTKRDQGGSGLGTHIMFNLVKQTLSGSIDATSEPDKGLRYYIQFPKNMAKPLPIFEKY
ncbi:hypothetical protein P20652_2094 [Pseudoalteromonas sp. BSi20652]|nr:hypothetical protein P20652_2094 [Pseudoalteromonas sp. BSi20652]